MQSALLDSTLILLLTGAENTTAINIRKKILLNDTTTTEVVTAELTLLESLLTSPLPKHNKSPTLWQHRRWVVSTFVDIKGQEFRMELSIVQRSTKVHPRNYYAWGYARWIRAGIFHVGD
jgi:protein prenyltransferase alpha subunit repeat containing protein 1